MEECRRHKKITEMVKTLNTLKRCAKKEQEGDEQKKNLSPALSSQMAAHQFYILRLARVSVGMSFSGMFCGWYRRTQPTASIELK